MAQADRAHFDQRFTGARLIEFEFLNANWFAWCVNNCGVCLHVALPIIILSAALGTI
jgi:hypothetical protein